MKNYNEIAESIFERREQYEKEKKSKKKRLIRTVTPICCVCLVVLLGFAAWQGGVFDKEPILSAEDAVIPGIKDWYGPGEEEESTAITLQNSAGDSQVSVQTSDKDDQSFETDGNSTTFATEELTEAHTEGVLCETYVYEITQGQFSEYVGGKVIAEDRISEKLADVTFTAGWKRVLVGEWLTQEKLRGEMFSIKGVGNDVAVAVKFIDKGEGITTSHYYVMLNPEADLSAVSEYVISAFSDSADGVIPE